MSADLWPLIEAYGSCRADCALNPNAATAGQYLKLAESNLRDALTAPAPTDSRQAPVRVLSDEQAIALREAHEAVATEEYFVARPQMEDLMYRRRIFEAGHKRGWTDALASIHPSAESEGSERDRCAAICDDEARIRREAGDKHPEDSPARDRCYAAARAAVSCANGIRSGERPPATQAPGAPTPSTTKD